MDQERFNVFKGTSWCLDPAKQPEGTSRDAVDSGENRGGADGRAGESRPLRATAAERGDEDDPERRQVKIRRNAEAQRDGYTPDCEGCEQAELGLDHRAHSASCRAHLETAMREDADRDAREGPGSGPAQGERGAEGDRSVTCSGGGRRDA